MDEHLDYQVMWLVQVSPVYTRLSDWLNGARATVLTQTRTWVEPGTTIDTPVRDSTQRATPTVTRFLERSDEWHWTENFHRSLKHCVI